MVRVIAGVACGIVGVTSLVAVSVGVIAVAVACGVADSAGAVAELVAGSDGSAVTVSASGVFVLLCRAIRRSCQAVLLLSAVEHGGESFGLPAGSRIGNPSAGQLKMWHDTLVWSLALGVSVMGATGLGGTLVIAALAAGLGGTLVIAALAAGLGGTLVIAALVPGRLVAVIGVWGAAEAGSPGLAVTGDGAAPGLVGVT